MPRAPRVNVPDRIYHVSGNGNKRNELFRDDRDRQAFLAALAGVVQRHGWRCAAYCLLSTHYHLLVETPNADLSRGMQRLNSAYAQAFNRRHRERGHVFRGRYYAALPASDAHLCELARYVALNPVRAGLCVHPADWPWSSFEATVGLRPPWRFLRADILLALFGNDVADQQDAYRRFVEERCPLWPSAGSDPT